MSSGKNQQVGLESASSEGEAGYDPPMLVSLGTFEVMTRGAGLAVSDGAGTFTTFSPV